MQQITKANKTRAIEIVKYVVAQAWGVPVEQITNKTVVGNSGAFLDAMSSMIVMNTCFPM
ncbi:MAG: hypothetical protein V1902_01195 [Candidatus Falkowbacteria bacterium]